MATRTVYRVTPRRIRGKLTWVLLCRGKNLLTSGRDRTKATAVLIGRSVAKQEPLSQLVIHKRDGTIEKEYTYGADPRRRRG